MWKKPDLSDVGRIFRAAVSEGSISSHCSYANIFLLKEKYGIEIAYHKDFVLKRLHGKDDEIYCNFPLGCGDVDDALDALRLDAKMSGNPLNFCLLSEKQADYLKNSRCGDVNAVSCRGEADYIYLQASLSGLEGKKYSKKRNHISRFSRTYPDWHYTRLSPECSPDALLVARLWLAEHGDNPDGSLTKELGYIEEALKYKNELGLSGGVLYVGHKPVAMTLASPISSVACDVHFEKALGEYAKNGAYAAVNNCFARSVPRFEYINREEDLDNAGLRKAKLSYYPEIVFIRYRISNY